LPRGRYFYGRLKNLKGAALDAAVDDALKSVNLAEPATRQKLSGEYSGGMKRRLSVAISLIGNPLVVYLDEPSTGLDPASRHQLWEAILKAKKDRTIILTTHSMEEAEVLCDKIGIFVAGELRCFGAPQQLTHRYGSNYSLTVTVNPGMVPQAQEFLNKLAAGASVFALSPAHARCILRWFTLFCLRLGCKRACWRHPALQHPHQQHHARANILQDGGCASERGRQGLGRGQRVPRRRFHSGDACGLCACIGFCVLGA
jgi:ABC-type multidrug transport system ATPase subunit